ncbi:ABC transporter ATP-binding protein [Nocardia takedensis]|uniref:ABC transporter ATP-binding protein n=1 Tax=Nocardia takedensis TaxID=259390 RepID=UPI00031D9114|nr:ABC transporter ATP-binding protein [Nocardia takedensis]
MPVIEVTDLRKRYGTKQAVDGVSFSVERGEIFGILGPNGAGKTTTVECVEGLRRADSGRIDVLGLDPASDGARLRRRIGVQLQSSELPDRIKVWEALDLYASFYDDPADWRELLEDWGLGEKRDAYFGKLSGGQKQRVSIALALIGRPEIVVFDELTAALDPQARRDTWRLVEQIRERDVTVLLVTHFMDEAEHLCDRLAVIDAGKVVAVDSPAGLIDSVRTGQKLRMRIEGEWRREVLSDLPEVEQVGGDGTRVEVSGTGNLVYAVIAALARAEVLATDIRLEQPSLDDAFVALTGRRIA